MKTKHPVHLIHHWYMHAKEALEKAKMLKEKQHYQFMIGGTTEAIKKEGVWLVKFIDLGKWTHKNIIYLLRQG